MNNLKVEEALQYIPTRVRPIKKLYVFNLLEAPSKSEGRNDRTWSYAAFAKKHYKDWQDRVLKYNPVFNEPPLSETELRSTVLKSNEKTNYFGDDNEEAPKARSYNMEAYRALGIKKPNFIIERLIKEKSINFEFGPKGNGKTELALGFGNALARGKPILQYDCPEPYPVYYADFEMDGHDILERDEAYRKYYGGHAGDYFHLLQWEQQVDQNIPDIQGEVGQDFILGGLEQQRNIVGKPPLLILDNLRSASGYDENDSNDWRPIGKWLLKLKGLGYPSLVLDHTGYDETHMRGTSSKSDWSYVNMGIKSRRVRNNPNMVMDIHFDKARGLRPDETNKFAAEYDFKGNWVMTQSKREADDAELAAGVLKLRKEKPDITQKDMAKILDVSTGTMSRICKKMKEEE